MKENILIFLLALQLAAMAFIIALQLKNMDYMFQVKLNPEKLVIATMDKDGIEEIIKGDK